MDIEGPGDGCNGLPAFDEITDNFFLVRSQLGRAPEDNASDQSGLTTLLCSGQNEGPFELGDTSENSHDHLGVE